MSARSSPRFRASLGFALLPALPAAAPAQVSEVEARRSGPGHPWQGGPSRVNPWSHALQTTIPIVDWRANGELRVEFSLHHSSMAVAGNPALSGKWRHACDLRLETWTDAGGVLQAALIEGDHTVRLFELGAGGWVNRDGYHDRLRATATGLVLERPTAVGGSAGLLPGGIPDGRVELELESGTIGRGAFRPAAFLDRFGNRAGLEYETRRPGRLVRISDGTGRSLQLRYGVAGRFSRLTAIEFVGGGIDRSGPDFVRTWTLGYDAQGRLESVTEPPLFLATYQTRLGYTSDGRGNLSSLADRGGAVTSFGYVDDAIALVQLPGRTAGERIVFDRPGPATRTVTDPLGVTTTRDFDRFSRLVTIVDAFGGLTEYTFGDADDDWAVSRVRRPSGAERSFDRGAGGRLLAVIDELGQRTDLGYDADGRLVRVEQPLCTDAWGAVEKERRATEFEYGPSGERVRERVRLGGGGELVTEHSYDARGNRVVVVRPGGGAIRIERDAFGNVVRVTTPAGRTSSWQYKDARISFNWTVPCVVVDGEGRRKGLVHDAWGRLWKEALPDGTTRTYRYDAMNRLVRLAHGDDVTTLQRLDDGSIESARTPAGRTRYGYLANGLLERIVIDPGGPSERVQHRAYDGANRLSSVDERGRATTFARDADGRLVRRTQPNGTTTRFTRDALGRVVLLEHEDRSSRKLASYAASFQENGLLRSVVESDAFGPVTSRFGYDLADRLVREEKSGAIAYGAQWLHDPDGQRLAEIENGVRVDYQRDADGRLLSTSAGDAFSWDANGRLVERMRGGERLRFRYDFDGALQGIDADRGAKLGWQPAFAYGDDGILRFSRRQHDDSGSLVLAHEYLHAAGSVGLQRTSDGAGAPLGALEFTWGRGLLAAGDPVAGSFFDVSSDPFGTVRLSTDDRGGVSFTGSLHNAFGKRLCGNAFLGSAGFAADAGVREEGDAGLLFDGRGYFDPQVAMALPTGPLDGLLSRQDAAESTDRLHLLRRLRDVGWTLWEQATDSKRRAEGRFGEALAGGSSEAILDALKTFLDLSDALDAHERHLEELENEIERLERIDRWLNPPPGTPRPVFGDW